MNRDSRGIFTEIFRGSWFGSVRPIQWSVVGSHENVLRGVRVHTMHSDYLVLVQGRALLALRDLRRGSPTEGRVSLLEADQERLEMLVIPPGVAHGFYFHTPSVQILGATEYWNAADELPCYYADPALEIPWPCEAPIVSEQDKQSPPLSEIIDRIPTWQPASHKQPKKEFGAACS
jgi:dTDP-4-dehydrorhamnose 3,5-epimerase